MVLIASSKQKKISLAFIGVVLFLGIGIAIPKLTVHDTVPVGSDYSCVDSIFNKPIKKLSWEYLLRAAGQTQVVHADSGYGEVKFYTLFRIPLDLHMSVNCLRTASSTGLVDGKAYNTLGVFHDSQVVDGTKSYASQRFGISFKYPIDFSVFEGEADASGVSPSDGFVSISPEPYTTQALMREFAGELPPSMGFAFYRNTQHLPLERWIKETNPAYTNYIPSDSTSKLTQTTITGAPAFKYHSEMGLYVTDYVTFLYKDWAVMFVINDMGPKTQADMQAVLTSLQLKP